MVNNQSQTRECISEPLCVQDEKKIERERSMNGEEMVFDTSLYFYERVIDLEFEI